MNNAAFHGKVFYLSTNGFEANRLSALTQIIQMHGGATAKSLDQPRVSYRIISSILIGQISYFVTTPGEAKFSAVPGNQVGMAIELGIPVVSESFIWKHYRVGMDAACDTEMLSFQCVNLLKACVSTSN